MKRAKIFSVGILLWLISAAVLATGTSAQAVYESIRLLPQQPGEVQKPEFRKFDEYSDIRFNDEKARLDAFAVELQQDPARQGYIIGYGGIICRPREAIARARRSRDYLVNTRQVDAHRVIAVDGGYRNEVGIELYLRPLGAPEPPRSPTVRRCTNPTRVSRKGRR